MAGHLNASSDLGHPRGDSQPAKTNARCSLPLLGSTSPCLPYKANCFCVSLSSSPPLLRIGTSDTVELSLKVTEATVLPRLYHAYFEAARAEIPGV